MRRTRVIPVLLIHNKGVYKTTKFKNPQYIGDPINAIRLFNDLEADEIIILDIDASKLGKSPDLNIIEDIVSEAFMPVAYGGGINNKNLAGEILRLGVEKIIFNHAAQQNTTIVQDCITSYGASSVVVCVDYMRGPSGLYQQFNHVDSCVTDLSLAEAVGEAQKLGVGEIMIHSVDRDGVMNGLDINNITEIAPALDVPLIVCGGAGAIGDLKEASDAGANAIAAGSMFLYLGKLKGIMINYPSDETLRQCLR
ncbi:HisA/HisF-related TIM barrel protein [Alphaproteobacteria bacterium]|nr:HisA/HisF-related TIM barrel protein [Alphaproteobacteria bacterium]